MKKFFLLSFLFVSCSVISPLQKSKLLTLSNLIDSGKFADAKEVAEEMVEDKQSAKWARTWYLRGSLCQTAYTEGVKKNDRGLFELYPNQLVVAHDSYKKALSIDRGGRVERQIAQKLVLLANEFQKQGEIHFNSKRYADAMSAFEHALSITQNPILSIETDLDLVYNTALAAYECREWDKAVKLLSQLHKISYSLNATHLLSDANMEKGDTIAAQKVLREGIDRYSDNFNLVLILTDLLFKRNDIQGAVNLLDEIISKNPGSYKLYYTKGLVYQKYHQPADAINAYKQAHSLSPDDIEVMVNIATCYYNIGVEIDENVRKLTNSRLVMEERAKATSAFESAVEWLDKAYEMGIQDQLILEKVYDLYQLLRVSDKVKSIENQDI